MSYTYASYTAALQTLVASTPVDVPFNTILPSCIDWAEQEIYRELNLLYATQGDYSIILTPGQRQQAIPNSFVVIDQVNALTPAGSNAVNGTRSPVTPTSLAALNFMWPGGGAVTGVPQDFAMLDQWTMILGPQPDAAYMMEVIGTFRPAPLSASNTSTFLTDRLPDLFLAASMVFFSGYMRNFGSQASDPQMGMSWQQQYDKHLASAMLEENRKRFWASSWSSQPASADAGNQRG